MFLEQAIEPFAIARNEPIHELTALFDIHVETARGYTLYDLYQVMEKNGGKAPATHIFSSDCCNFQGASQAASDPFSSIPGWEDSREGNCISYFSGRRMFEYPTGTSHKYSISILE